MNIVEAHFVEYRNIEMNSAATGLVLPLLLSGWLSSGRHARMICDIHQKALWYNQNFVSLCDRTGRFSLLNERFSFVSKADQTRFSDFVSDDAQDDTAFWINNREGNPVIAVQCQRIRLPTTSDCFGIRLAENDDFLASDHRHFESHFNLTRQETIVCRLMLQGKTVQDIVEIYGKSHDTVRFHVRNIYRKMAISSREELFAKLRHFLFS